MKKGEYLIKDKEGYRELWKNNSNAELAKLLNVGVMTIVRENARLGLKRANVDVDALRALFPDHSMTELKNIFKVSKNTMLKICRTHGLNHTPAQNEAIRNRIMGSKKGTTKVRHKTRKDSLPIGAIREFVVKRKGKEYPYVKIKTENGWAELAKYNWLQAGREIPKGCCISYHDKNRRNCELSNLYLRTKHDIGLEWRAEERKLREADPNYTKNKKRERKLAEKTTARLLEAERKREERERIRKEKTEAKEKERQAKKAERERLSLIAQASKVAKKRRAIKEKRIITSAIITPKTKPTLLKKSPVVYKTKQVDYSKMRQVRVDSKTIIYAKEGQSDEAAITAYNMAMDRRKQPIKLSTY